MIDNEKEYIVCAAILHDKAIPSYNIYGMELGYNHHDILKKHNNIVSIGSDAQGFMTSNGRFVDRKEAGKIAFECGQINAESQYLFSEDIY